MRAIVLLTLAIVLLSTASACAAWRVDIESKTVCSGQTGVTVDFKAYWDNDLWALTIPIVVRQITPGSFWTGTLPYDTLGSADDHPYSHGVTWKWANPWANIIEELRPGVPYGTCNPEGDIGYDGISPDHFCISAQCAWLYYAPPEPSGRTVVTIEFDVTDGIGQFEFDTACFSEYLYSIFMIDHDPYNLPPSDYGPTGDQGHLFGGFNKGVITIYCDCGVWGDVNGDEAINPVDVVVMVQYVYLSNDIRVQPLYCPRDAGDVNCDGAINPVDVVFYVQYVYLTNNMFCPDPCSP